LHQQRCSTDFLFIYYLTFIYKQIGVCSNQGRWEKQLRNVSKGRNSWLRNCGKSKFNQSNYVKIWKKFPDIFI